MQRNVFVSLAAAITVLAGCGGSSSSTSNINNGGTLGARVSRGALTAVSTSAITLNGSTLDDSTATVRVDDNPTGHEALKPGMIVTVKVDDKGKATDISSKAAVRGQAATVSGSTITVNGQTVRVDDSTHFDDNAGLAGKNGKHVRVSGFPDDRGGLRATRIEDDASSEFEVHGVASNVDTTAKTFTLTAGSTTYSVTATSLPAGIKEGSIVEVKSATAISGSAITASLVKLDDDLSGSGQSEAEVEGIVMSGTSSSFVVAGATVNTSASTKWIGGAPADLVPGVKVEAEGTLDASGNIAASKVSFRDSLRFQSTVSNLTGDAHDGSFQMLGGTLTVHVSDVTEFDDGLTMSTVTTQNIEVRAYPSAAGGNDVVATRVRLGRGGGGGSTGGTRIIIQGPVSNVDATAKTFKILGYTISAASASSLTRDDNPLSNDATPVLTNLTDGMVVKARADSAAALSGTTFTAKELELEDDR